MAANVPLTLTVETIGTEGVKRLKDDVAALGKEGAGAAPEFQQLGAEIDKLGQQTGLANVLKTLTNEIDQLSTAQAKSAETAQRVTTDLNEAKATTATYAEAQRAAKTAVIEQQDALFQLRQELARKKNETSSADKEERTYTEAIQALGAQIIKAKDVLREKTNALREAKDATTQAATAERAKANEANAANTADAAAAATLEKKSAALREVTDKLRAAGVQTTTLAETESLLINSFKNLAGEIAAVQAATEAKLAAEKRAAQEEERLMIIQIVKQKELRDAAALAAQEIIGDYSKMEAAQAKMAAQTKAAGDALTNAFSTVGVRSVAQIRAEIETVNQSMGLLATKGGLTGAELKGAMASAQAQVNALEKEIRTVTNQLTLADKAANLFQSSMGQFTAGNLAAQGIQFLVTKLMDLGRAFIDAMVQGQQLSRGLNVIYKDAGVAAAQLDFLRKTSAAAGVAVGDIAQEFVKFSASMKLSNIPIEQSNALFQAMTRATASLGLSAADTGGILNALGQSANKGTVQMEELRGQIGDRLPGALGLAAKGMGLTEAELTKLVTSGNLAFKDFIVPFTGALKELEGKSDTLVGTWGRLKGAFTVFAQSAGDAGWATVLVGAMKALAATIGPVLFLFESFVETIGLVGSGVVRLAQALAGNKNAFKGYSDEIAASGQRIRDVGNAIVGVLIPQANLTTAVSEGTKAMLNSADAATRVDAALRAAAGATEMSATAAKLQADTTLMGVANINKFNVEVGRLIETQTVATEAASANAKAVKLQGEARVELAKQQNDALALANAESQSAVDYAAAMDKVAVSQRAELDLLLVQRQRIREVEEARGTEKAAIEKQTEALTNKITKMQAEAEQSTQAAEKAKAEATGRKLAIELLRDNSAEITKYTILMHDAQANVDRLTQAEKDGWATKQQVKDATLELARVTALHTDAVKDSIKNLDLETKMRTANIDILIAQANAGEKHYIGLAAQAKAIGDVVQQHYWEIEAKKQVIKQLELKMELERLQNEAAKLEIELKRKLIDTSTEEGKTKAKLLDIELKMLEVKNINNEAIKEQIRLIEGEIQGIRNSDVVRQNSQGGLNADTNARNTNAGAIERQNAALEKQQKLTSDGFKRNADGSAAGTFSSSTANTDLATLRTKTSTGAQLTSDDLASAQAAFDKATANVDWLQKQGGSVSLAAMQSANADWTTAKQILDSLKFRLQEAATAKDSAATSSATSSSTSSGATTMTINLNGASTNLSMASQADATALANLLQQLGTSATRAA